MEHPCILSIFRSLANRSKLFSLDIFDKDIQNLILIVDTEFQVKKLVLTYFLNFYAKSEVFTKASKSASIFY